MSAIAAPLSEPLEVEESDASRKPPSIAQQLLTHRLSMFGFILLGAFAFVAIFAPVIAPPLANSRDVMKIPRDGFGTVPLPPGSTWVKGAPPLPFWWQPLTGLDHWTHPFGVASGGWDIFYGVVWGTRTAFLVGIIITTLTVAIGVIVGTVSAYYGGVVDLVIQRITEVFLTFPFLMAALTAGIAVVVFGWMGNARLIRGDILSVRERDYVLAARAVGAKDSQIMLRHIVPNAIFPTLVVASLNIGTFVVTFAALSFLGLGAEQGYADWGQLLAFARGWITTLDQYWYIVFFPGMALVLFTLGWNLVGDAVRDVLDPRMRKTR
ncbi:MAG: ABC transporter permease [Chloroflexi bacterium]|nr:ABC transporter permease [Chloroflexota bacterium]